MLNKYPLPTRIDTVTVSDTVVRDRIVHVYDTIQPPVMRMDTMFYMPQDGTVINYNGFAIEVTRGLLDSLRMNVRATPDRIYYNREVVVSDTVIVREREIVRESISVVNPWEVLWDTIKPWLWILLLLLFLFFLVRLLLKTAI